MTTTCPACGKPATYSSVSDRYVHDDGSENGPCWLRVTRGASPRPPKNSH